ncbi:signal transduction histidine kinase [Streptosporangium becharense]|uniref:histidine kinase n=1 Tax=Streptosporangium becharense TaxID=1816182 RepID=A0A7W9MH20_9ACTN|nr:histidine kinase [Streptosporangium becharense]MBB2912463.1 signal transduction histidine kinase [Streptosporangium becharense]MBB5820707.1 signal transduction histidine kinase [Streptosporangium becharense]
MKVMSRLRARLADQRVADAALVLGCLVLTALAAKAHWSVLPRPVIVMAGTAGSLTQMWRRRLPQPAAVAGAAAYALSGNPGPLLVGLYSGASYAPRRQVWALAVAGWAGFAGWSWIDVGRLTADDAVSAAVAAAAVTVLGLHTATRRALAASLRERAESAEAGQRLRDERARSAERTRIAREMHDVLAHKVSLITLHAGALELAASGGSARVEQGAALIRVTAREALQELRYVLGVLRAEPGVPDLGASPDGGEPFTDPASLVRAAGRAGQRVELRDHAGSLPPAMARVVYRVIQEGLTNARKHAPDAPVTVAVDRDAGDAVTVTVDNAPGSGAPADLPGSGSGLVGLAERVRLVGGALSSGPLSPSEGGGWRLRAVVPWLGHGAGERATAGGTPAEHTS